MEQLCECGEILEADDECCCSCGKDRPSALPPGKKKCIKCPKVLPQKAKFCTKCRARQVQEKQKRICCGEELSDDDEFCCLCGTPCERVSGASVRNEVLPSPSDAAPGNAAVREGNESKPSVPKEKNAPSEAIPDESKTTERTLPKNGAPAKESDSKSDIQEKQSAPIVPDPPPSAVDDTRKAPENVRTPSETSLQFDSETTVPHNQPAEDVPEQSGGPGSSVVMNRQQLAGLDSSANLQDNSNEKMMDVAASQQHLTPDGKIENKLHSSSDMTNKEATDTSPNLAGEESSDSSRNADEGGPTSVPDMKEIQTQISSSSVNEEAAPKKPAAFTKEKLPHGDVSPTLVTIQQAFTNVTLQESDENVQNVRTHIKGAIWCSELEQNSYPKDPKQMKMDEHTTGFDDAEQIANDTTKAGEQFMDCNTGMGEKNIDAGTSESGNEKSSQYMDSNAMEEPDNRGEGSGQPMETETEGDGGDGTYASNQSSEKSDSSADDHSVSEMDMSRNHKGEGYCQRSTSENVARDSGKRCDTEKRSLTGKKRKSQSDGSYEDEVNLPPETGKKKVQRPIYDSRPELTEEPPEVLSNHPYQTRSKTTGGTGTGSHQDGPSTQMQVSPPDTKMPNENDTSEKSDQQVDSQDTDAGHTDAEKNFKEGLPQGTFYRKKDLDENSTRKKKKNTESKLKVELIHVTFKVVIGPQFKFDPSKEVGLRFSKHRYGGWNEPSGNLLNVESKCDGDYYLLTGTVPIHKQLLVQGHLEYKYIVQMKSNPAEYQWEHIMRRNHGKNQVNRKLRVNGGYDKDTLDVYDIIMFPEPEEFLKRAHNFYIFQTGSYYHHGTYDALTTGRKTGALAMLPQWPRNLTDENPDGHLEHLGRFLTQLDAVSAKMKELILDDTFNQPDIKLIRKIMDDYLHQGLKILSGIESDSNAARAELQFFIAIAAVYICSHNMLDISEEHFKLICEHLPDAVRFSQRFGRIFGAYEKNLAYCARVFIEMGMCRKLFHWLFAMPLLHFLSDQCIPYEKKCFRHDHNARDGSWWGLKGISKQLDTFKKDTHNHVPLEPLMEKLQGLFAADYLLPRTILATLREPELSLMLAYDAFDSEACLALVYYHFKTGNLENSGLKDALMKILEKVQEQLTASKIKWTDASADRQALMQEVSLCCLICGDIVELTRNHYSFYRRCDRIDYIRAFANTSSSCIGLLWEFLSDQQMLSNLKRDGEDLEQDARNFQRKFSAQLLHWLYKNVPYRMLSGYRKKELTDKKELEAWSCLLGISWPEREVQECYANELRQKLETRIFKLDPEDAIALYANEDYNKCHPVVEEVVSAAAFKAVEETCRSGKLWSYSSIDIPRISTMLEKVFMNAWPRKTQDVEVILKHALQWPSMINYIKLFFDVKRQLLNDTCLFKMQECIDMLDHMMRMIISGTILVDYLNRILENKKAFLDICGLIMSFKHQFAEINTLAETLKMPAKDAMQKVLALRRKETDEFSKVRSRVNLLLTMCKDISPVDVDHLERKESVTASRLHLNQMCNPRVPGKGNDTEPVTVTYFELPTSVYEILEELPKYHEFQLFRCSWKRAAAARRQGDKMKVLTLEEVVKNVWHPCVSYCTRTCQRIQDGSIKLEEVSQLLRMIKDIQQLQKEIGKICTLKKIGGDLSWIDLRFKQFKQYEKMQRCKVSAETILQIVEYYDLTGDFSSVERLLQSVQDPKQTLSSIEDKMVIAGKKLERVDDNQVKCMGSFIKAKEMIVWLRDNLKGTQEVKVLVDLAMIRAAGQGDAEVNRVSCLHLAVTGFAPLIYDLKESAGFGELMDCLEEVWRVLENDDSLPSRLDEVSTHLQWLQEVHKAHGDVEMNALELTATINAKGVFQVGRLKANTDGKLSLEDVVSLVLPAEEKRERQVLGLKELHDLQSKLMLVAGKAEKGKDEVDRFSQIFDGIIKLASTYVKICEAGSILFKDWKARFYCSMESKSCVQMDFDLVKKKLIGRPTNGLDVLKHLDEICSFLESCLKDWIQYIQQQRDNYKELNYFTMSQLVKLRSSLSKLKARESSLDPEVFHMLHIVKENCSERDLHTAMDDAWKELKSREIQALRQTSESEESEMLSGETQFIQSLTEEGFSEKLAVKAMKKFGTDNFDDALMWCADVRMGDEEEDSDEDVEMQSDKTWAWVQENLLQEAEQFDSQNVCSLKPVLENVWKRFLSSSTQSVSDYLSVDHLGLMLKHLRLAVMHNLERTAPKHLVKGKPNLVVCPARDVLNVVLSIYYQDEAKPLPKRDEVLYCTENTTQEEVDLLWRRALSDRSGRIFCILFVEQLSYDVSETAVRRLEEFMRDSKDYYLVIVCASEGETKSQLVTAFENCRIGVPNVMPDQICRYLENKFALAENELPVSVDPERSTVRLVRSERPGMGKSLFVERLAEKLLPRGGPASVTLPLHQRKIDVKKVLVMLLQNITKPGRTQPRIYHFDIAYEVLEGVDYLLFNLLILGSVSDQDGNVWQRSPLDLYLIETLPRLTLNAQAENGVLLQHVVLRYLPSLLCRSPVESLKVLKERSTNPAYKPELENWSQLDQLMDEKTFRSEPCQRVSQYLQCHDQGQPMNTVNPLQPEGTQEECLQILLKHFVVQNPTWAELHHFIAFLDKQLRDFERSVFCSDFFAVDLPGFKAFVLRFMLQMSNDFATRSLVVSEETPGAVMQNRMEDLDQYQLRRKWEESSHPFLFFNDDTVTMTFLGFNINRANGSVTDPQTGRVIMANVMTVQLFDALQRNRVNLSENFDALQRDLKIEKLCKVIGVPDGEIYDPDATYQLTTDNVKKILAIQMRFRCGIPVVLMGETGCGKTRLIQFMCDLQVPPGSGIKNLIKVKTHGGTTEADIRMKVREASRTADHNMQRIMELRGPDAYLQTVLFFDEANTTEAIGLIKEIMVDKRMDGESLNLNNGLKIVAACNPYRRHGPEMVKKLEQAGLGYYVKADETKEKLGEIPMRQLVYRVQALPQSLLPLVWDFGQLTTDTEKLYIKQIVIRFLTEGNFGQNEELCDVISSILAQSQEYIRCNKDECIFVSLRDVERVMRVMMWFYKIRNLLFEKMDDLQRQEKDDLGYTGANEGEDDDDDDRDDDGDSQQEDDTGIDPIVRSLILALGVCYIASLENRTKYCRYIEKYFLGPCELEEGYRTIQQQIEYCQNVFVEEVQVADNIAKNLALKENLFMMVVCVELRIPLFLVGKPGSSKSLAKTIVDNALEGRAAKSELFRQFKQAHMISCQCSRLSTADVIVGTFQQCAKLQENKKDHLKEFVSVVILDEVGLAEDSPHMPLKSLHPLLEDGCIGDEASEEFKKVAFIGISNWALDPAKTNRGILLQRGVPKEDELHETAKSIAGRNPEITRILSPLIKPLTSAYWEVYITGLKHGSEFFGLRDFYSLIKMLLQLCEKSKYSDLSWRKLMHAVWRNFDGLESLGDKDQKNPIKIFERYLEDYMNKNIQHDDDPHSSSLVSDGLSSDGRYLLILTEKDTPLDLLHQQLPNAANAIVIYGSSFPRDQEYTQVCRNINSIKMCMEAGRTVILHNLENLYESLYDALNQYYIIMGPNRFVDLGLGTQRVKCIVHKNFRLVVVAEKETVYKKFSIPLINRLEKHFMHVSSMLTRHQNEIVESLQWWTKDLARASQKSSPADVLVGYHVDAVATVVLQITKDFGPQVNCAITPDIRDCVEQETKEILLETADPEALMRLSADLQQYKDVVDLYFNKQSHESLADYLHKHVIADEPLEAIFCQITTYSKLLSSLEKEKIAKKLGWESSAVFLQSLQAFNTEQQFSKLLRNLFMLKKPWDRVLILQCDSGNEHSQLLACARHHIMNTFQQCREELQENSEEKIGNTHVILVVQLPRQKGGCFVSFQGGKWLSAHVDDLRPSPHPIVVQQLKRKSVRELVEEAVRQDPKCREYLTKMSSQSGGRMTDISANSLRRNQAKMKELIEEDFADMPPLEEPDEDINVYRPERERDGRITPPDTAMEANDEDSGLMRSDSAQLGGDDVGMDTSEARIETDESRMDVDDALDEHVAAEGGELCLHQLLFSCCCKAATMLRDINHQHTLERIHTIKEHFPEPGYVTEYSDFAVIVQMRLLGLLSEKESRAGSIDQARKWLNGALQNISEIGTFRRAWMSFIEKQLAPLLAGLLKFADTNNNMAILEKTPPGHWLHRLWLQMFSNPAATVLEYKDLLSVNSEKLPEEFMVRMTGYGGSEMSGSLPFSWVIKDSLDNLLEQAKHFRGESESDLEDTFHKTEMGMYLKQAYEEVGLEKVVDLYLNDYVQMVYRVVTEDKQKEYGLIRDMIVTYCKNEMKEAGEEPFVMKLSDIHKAFSKIQNRVQNLSQLLSVFPEGVTEVQKFMADQNKEHALMKTSEMTHDMVCVEACLQQLKPDAKEVAESPDMRQAWLLKVELLLPMLGRIIEQLRQSNDEFGRDCKKYHHTLRCERDKVKAVYLFYKHVQAPQIRDDPMMKVKVPVWSFFRDKCDFSKKETMEQVKKIMKLCNDQASKVYLKIRETCGICEDAMKTPVQLPCDHIFCKPCLDDLKEFEDLRKCPTCKKKLPKDFKIIVIPEKKEAIEAHNRYKQRCNTFFIELIAQLVFVRHQEVDEAVVEMLLSCVTRESKLRETASQEDVRVTARTKKLTVLDDCIDPTPVVRSLLLQLLLRARIDRVEEYMDTYFHQAKRFLGNDDEQLLQLCLLFVHSFQDRCYHTVSQQMPGSVNEMETVKELLEVAEEQLDEPALSMASIEAIGKFRCCLDKLSGYLYRAYILKKEPSPDRLRNLLESAESACMHRRADYIRWYLLRQLVRQSGLEYVVKMLQSNQKLMWILPNAISVKDFNQPHVLSIYGEPFENLKVGIRQACRANDSAALWNTFKNLPKQESKIYLLVALFVDVTLSVADNILPDQNSQKSALVKCLAKCGIDTNSEMVKGLLGNQLGQHAKPLTVQPNQDVTEQSLASLITHFIIVLTNAAENCLINPFKTLIETPQTMQDFLLPTMPQDDLVEIYEAMAKELKGGWDAHGNFGVYRCQNQHIFMVNNCGHLTEHKSVCPTCKAPIGGQSYNKPLPGVTSVKREEIQDTTEKGHCLGPADTRTKNPYPERKLNRLTMTVMRFFVHLALYAGANRFPREVTNIIKPKPQSVTTFLWEHLVFDLDVLTRCINRSRDDVFLLMHTLLKSIASTAGTRAQFTLKDKTSRENWEEAFANTYLNPVLSNYDDVLQQATAVLSGENKFLKKLYEQEDDEDEIADDNEEDESNDGEEDAVSNDNQKELDFNDMFSLGSLWRYKTRICLEDVASKLEAYRSKRKEQKDQEKKKRKKGQDLKKDDPEDCDVLYNFLDKHEQLGAIRYLPNITRLVRGLVRENHRALYYHEASRLTLERFLKTVGDRIQREMYSSFMDDFAAAWDIVRPFLSSYVFGGLSVPKEYTSEPIRKEKTVIATLLPSTEGRGLCAVGLIHYLARLQNDFLRTLPGVNTEEGIVSIEEVFPSNLIYFHPDKDLLPMFVAHCDYSLEVGKTLQIAYNFPALQRQLEERLLRGIPLIEIKIEHVLFREDLTNATKLANLCDIIPQAYLSGSVVRQIQGELRHLSDITECLLMLDIALGFLMSFRNQSPHTLLTQFLSETLGLNISNFPPKAQQACELRHVQALWLLLSHESAKILSKTAQDPFERVQKSFTEELTDKDKASLDDLLPHMNTELFLAELHECILMQITKPVEMSGDEQVSNWKHSLRDVLGEYINSKDDPPDIPVIQRFPDTIFASKCVSVWKFIFQRSIKM